LNQQLELYKLNEEARASIFSLSEKEMLGKNSTERQPAWIYLETLITRVNDGTIEAKNWNVHMKGIFNGLPIKDRCSALRSRTKARALVYLS
jgi:hypothetical protein